ncbi:hypothetical protein CkP1_0213 [Citrobacter phage CkP1]|nr:hypothetical protein CkP1_0213 [Citrobacter phage CkP1]
MIELNEVFDEEKLDLPVVNLYPKTKIPQIFAVGEMDGNSVTPAFRMCTYTSGGDTNKNVKPGDKMTHVVMLSLNEKGSLVKLKNLGPDPVGTISTVFNIVYSSMKQYKIDAVLFRMTKSKIGGQARQLQIIMDRLVRSRTGGRYVILKELWDYNKKYSYILIYRKNADLSTIPGVPEISTEMFTKAESDVGDVYIEKKTGQQISKAEAIAASIAKENDARTEQSVISRAKVSRRQIAASQSLSSEVIADPQKFNEYESTAAEFSKPATAKEIPEASQIIDSISSKAVKSRAVKFASEGAIYHLRTVTSIELDQSKRIESRFSKEFETRLGNASLTSVESMQAYIQTLLDTLEEYKYNAMKEIMDTRVPQYNEQKDREEMAKNIWNVERTKLMKSALHGYAKTISSNIEDITRTRTPTHYTASEKRGIKEYVGSGYSDINNMLLGRYNADNYDTLDKKEVTTAIKNLDAAFKRGDRIPAGITLWRSQTVRKPIFEAMVKNKVFYFRNYVSTSLSPIIFGGWKGNQAVAMASDNTRAVLNVDKSDETAIIPDQEIRLAQEYGEERIRVSIGWAIDGADKINVIYPGDLSNIASEMEVILPRGTMLKVNKITDASYSDGLVYNNQKFVQAEVMTSEQLDEAVIYDGDVLMESGEVVEYEGSDTKFDFNSFAKSTKVSENNKILSILASMIDIEDTPEKFVL